MPATLTETKDSNAVLFGLGVLAMATYAASPATYTDVGYLKGAEFTYTRDLKEFIASGVFVKRLVYTDRFELDAQFAETSIANLVKVFQPTAAGTISNNKFVFGGQKTITRFATRFENTRDDGSVVQIDIFKAIPGGAFKLAFTEDNFLQYPVNYVAEADTTHTAGQQYGKIQIGL